MTVPAIDVRGLVKRYGNRTVVDHVIVVICNVFGLFRWRRGRHRLHPLTDLLPQVGMVRDGRLGPSPLPC